MSIAFSVIPRSQVEVLEASLRSHSRNFWKQRVQLPEKYLHRKSSLRHAWDRIIPKALAVGTHPREVATTSFAHSVARKRRPSTTHQRRRNLQNQEFETNVENSFSPLCRPRRVYVRSGTGSKPQRRSAQHRSCSQDD